jgi:hypothetical protein
MNKMRSAKRILSLFSVIAPVVLIVVLVNSLLLVSPTSSAHGASTLSEKSPQIALGSTGGIAAAPAAVTAHTADTLEQDDPIISAIERDDVKRLRLAPSTLSEPVVSDDQAATDKRKLDLPETVISANSHTGDLFHHNVGNTSNPSSASSGGAATKQDSPLSEIEITDIKFVRRWCMNP